MNREIYRLKVIVVDDEPKILNNIVAKVERLNMNCEIIGTASNGEEAIELIKDKRPHIVLTDIKMPKMDGLELAKLIKNKYPSIYVVIVSGYSDFSLAQEAIQYGVFNYLLKPVNYEKLSETINNIKDKLEQVTSLQPRSIVLSDNSLNMDEFFIDTNETYHLCILAINFYNVCYDISDLYLQQFYHEKIKSVNWHYIMSLLGSKIDSWIVTDGYTANEKIILLKVHRKSSLNMGYIAKEIKTILEENHKDIFINICYQGSSITRDKIWLYTQRMRHVIQNKVLFAKPSIFLLEGEEKAINRDKIYSIKLRIQNSIKVYIINKEFNRLKEEIKEIFSYLDKSNIEQVNYQKVITFMLDVFEQTFTNYDLMHAEKLQLDLYRLMSLTHNCKEVEDSFMAYLNYLIDKNDKRQIDDNIKSRIISYVDENYTKINKVEEVAEVFNYNYAYLSRLFKKITGTTMNKYITEKRIKRAQDIIKNNEELSLRQIGEAVGYDDQHYFSRIFKLVTGVSPSKYREMLSETD